MREREKGRKIDNLNRKCERDRKRKKRKRKKNKEKINKK